MTGRILGTALTSLIISTAALAQTTTQQPTHKGSINIGLIYPLSTTGLNAPNCSNYFSANAIAGVSYDEKSFCASGVTNVVRHDANGLIAAGFSNHILNNSVGLQAAGFATTVKRHTKGVQAAGFFNYSGSVKGAQFGGFANITKGEIEGFQGAGFANFASDADVQIAGFINRAYNVNTQIGGFINIAHKVEGVQIAGFINIADSSDYPIGIINIIKKGEKSLGVSLDENLTSMVSFRSGGRILYGIIGVGINLQNLPLSYSKEEEWPLYAIEAGIGAHIPVAKNFRINIEGTTVSLSDLWDEYYLTTSLRVMPAVTIGKKMEVFAGPTINFEERSAYAGRSLVGSYLWQTNYWGNSHGLYLGAMGGVSFKF